MDDLDHLSVEGYDFCSACGGWVLAGQKICGECAVAVAEAEAEVVTIEVDGNPYDLTPRRKREKRRRGPRSPRTMTERARDRARTRSWIRLSRIYEPMFAAIYHEEQLREGRDPVPLPPLRSDPTEVLLRDLEEHAERLRGTSASEPSIIPASAQRKPPSGDIDGPDS